MKGLDSEGNPVPEVTDPKYDTEYQVDSPETKSEEKLDSDEVKAK